MSRADRAALVFNHAFFLTGVFLAGAFFAGAFLTGTFLTGAFFAFEGLSFLKQRN